MSKLILGLGSNLNEPVFQLQKAVDYLKNHFLLLKVSRIYTSLSLLKDNQDDYYNAAVLAETDKTPLEVLDIIKSIENSMGRIKLKKWGERNIDIDIIDFNREIIKYENLEIPHNQMIYRSFVLLPLLDIVPDYIHPVNNLSLKNMIDNLSDDYNIKVLNDKSLFI